MKEYPLIDPHELIRIIREAELPTKSQPKHPGIFELVRRLKVHRLFSREQDVDLSKSDDWKQTVTYLSDALADGDFSALDDFCAAWHKVKVEGESVPVAGSGEVVGIASTTNSSRRPVTALIARAILQFQNDEGRPPTRQEILIALQDDCEDGLDDSEMSRQLKLMGLQDRIPKVSELS